MCRSSAISGRNDVRIGEIGRVFQAFIFQPEDVQVYLVSLEQVLVGKGLEALCLFAFVTVLDVVARDEIA